MSNTIVSTEPVSNGRLTNPALRRGLDILELFIEQSDPLRIPEITAALGIPRASAHELVQTLVDRGYLQPTDETPPRFSLGGRVSELAGAFEQSFDLAAEGRRAARDIAALCGETVQAGVRDGRSVVYISRIDSTHSLRLVSQVGKSLPAHCTAIGKMLLSALDQPTYDALFPDGEELPPMTANSIRTKEALSVELERIRSRGWADEYCESNPDAACVAAPVRDAHGATVAAMSIAVPTSRWSEERKTELAALVRSGAREFSRRLGARE